MGCSGASLQLSSAQVKAGESHVKVILGCTCQGQLWVCDTKEIKCGRIVFFGVVGVTSSFPAASELGSFKSWCYLHSDTVPLLISKLVMAHSFLLLWIPLIPLLYPPGESPASEGCMITLGPLGFSFLWLIHVQLISNPNYICKIPCDT